MKRLLSYIPTVLTIGVLAVILTSIIRPDLVPIPILEGAEAEPDAGPEAPPDTIADEETVDDGWIDAHPMADREAVRRELPVIRLRAPEVAERIGLETAEAEATETADAVTGNAETSYDLHLFAEVIPRVRGIVHEVIGDHGLKVRAGDVLAVIDSAEVGTAKADFLAATAQVELAERTAERTRNLVAEDALPKAQELQADANLHTSKATMLAARQKLRNLGYSDEEIQRIADRSETDALLDVVAPIDGTVVELHAVRGEALEPTTVMFQVTDLDMLWCWIDVPEAEFRHVREDDPVHFEVPGMDDAWAEGAVEWVEAQVNPETRTVRVLAALDNQSRRLRAKQFGTASVRIGDPRQAVLIPRSAVQDFAPGVGLVFIEREDGAYVPQRVETVPTNDPDTVEVTWGLEPGRPVVTTGSFLLMTELRRDELAGD